MYVIILEFSHFNILLENLISIMPEKEDKTAEYPVGPDGKKLKPCCACPETKRPRDECIMEKVFFVFMNQTTVM